MIKITDGVKTFDVTNGAYEKVYKYQGYKPVIEKKKEAKSKEPDIDKNKELEQKPIGQWTKSELKDYAEDKGIDIAGLKSTDDVREVIKKAIADKV